MLQCVGYYVEICEISNSQAQSADDALLLCPESHDWGLWSNLLSKFGDNFGFPRGDISHPLNPALDFRLQNYNISLNNARKIIKKSKQPYQILFISYISNDRFGLKNLPANY